MSDTARANDPAVVGRHSPVSGLDHVGVVSATADELFDAYERMGFQLTPVSRHSGALRPDEAPVPWGTGNRCAMFRRGYLELLAILDPAMPCGVFPTLLRRYTGLHIVAFGCDRLEQAQIRLSTEGVSVLGVVALERELETRDGRRKARFDLLRLDEEETPEARINLIAHRTPQYLWQPHLLSHPNGAHELADVIVCVDDLSASAARYEKILGLASRPVESGRRFELPHGAFSLVDRTGLGALVPDFRLSSVPQVVAFTVTTTNIAAARRCLDENRVPSMRWGNRIIVPAVAGSGAAVIFLPSEKGRS